MKIKLFGKLSKINRNPNIIPVVTLRKKLILGTLFFQNRKTGVNPITIVPEMVVADKISASKKTGKVPNIAIIAIDARPKVKSFTAPKSITKSFENDEKVESKVDAADVIIIKLITSKTIMPKNCPTSTAA